MITNAKKRVLASILLTSAFVISGCDNSSNDTSYLSIAVKDAPIDGATRVMVQFEGIELKPKDGNSFEIDLSEIQSVNLLDYQGSNSLQLFNDVAIEPGEYNWIRLKVNAQQQAMDSFIEFDTGAMYSLYIPSGSQTGLKLNNGFTAPANGEADFTIDFDLRQSIHQPGNASDDYFLRPVLRIVDNTQVGHIEGTVAANLVAGETCGEVNAVYLYDTSELAVDDIGSANPPQTTATVKLENNSNLAYSLGFILPGDYTLALTCQADLDDPETDDDLVFIAELPVTVEADQTATINFE
ncbi:DUF4382 domain-containing protein [Pleionea mediterranea]|uniref:Uncharacterized protein DUF4382 n=1 Tax=Pleionea mediterranea TaxID=523701 RepID=A0A316FT16_9GAMM|nr:DUF4382 domain-containing protein [Pleionea mediterranea]PWK51901.1 uncharacterized protein DUF4382 [Pleionea mediterranea]